jgi:hypothetical protein
MQDCKEVAMRFPNLVWAIEDKRLRHYEVADRVGISSFRFSRCLRGRSQFEATERQRIVEALGYPEAWLFASPTPPARSGFQSGEAAPFMASVADR